MNKKMLPHIIAVGASVVFIVLGLACASSSDAVKSADSIDEVYGLRNKLEWIKLNAQSGGNYLLEVNNDEGILFYNGNGLLGASGHGILSYKDKTDITITIKGNGQNRTLYNYSGLFGPQPGCIFRVDSGVTLVLDENITLKGSKSENLKDAPNSCAVVVVSSGGTLVMNEGSTITGGVNCSGNGGGVHVSGGATFLMKGGTITNNQCYPVADSAALAASGGIVTNLTDPGTYKGGGVYVAGRTSLFGKTTPGGTFTKTGGTIYGYVPGDLKSNIVVGFMAQGVVPNNGHAVYAETGKKRKETTAGPDVDLHISDDTFSGGWDF
jgi:hypothetical protein